MAEFMITEEVTGNYSYHISEVSTFTKSLCGKELTMMWTNIPFSTWGYVGHLRERYCDKCREIYDRRMIDGN